MRVSSNFFQSGNHFLNINSVNRSLNRNAAPLARGDKSRDNDRLTLSSQGKMMKSIENLMKQKEDLIERKSELVSGTLKKGGNLKSIEVQMEFYEKQLSSIDEQIAQITAEHLKQATEKEDEKKPKSSDENKTAEQIEAEKLSNLAGASQDVKQAAMVSAVKNQVEGEVRVKQSEINLGEIQIDRMESAGLSGVNVQDMVAHAKNTLKQKEATVSGLQNKAMQLDFSQGQGISDASSKLDELNQTEDLNPVDPKTEKAPKENPEDSEAMTASVKTSDS